MHMRRNLSFQEILLFMVFRFSKIIGLIMVPSDARSTLPLHGFSSSKLHNKWINRRISCSNRGTLPISPSTIVVRGGEESISENEKESFSTFLEDFAREMKEIRKDLLDETRLEMEQLKLEILEEKRRRRQHQEKEEDEKNPIASGSLTSTEDILPELSAKAEVCGNEGIGNLQEMDIENRDDDLLAIKEERKDDDEEEETGSFNVTESENKSLLTNDDASQSDNERGGQFPENEFHDQDSINEEPIIEEFVQSEDYEYLAELADGCQSSEILNQRQQLCPDTGKILDVDGYTTHDGEAQQDVEDLLKLQSNMKKNEYKKTKKIVSKSIKATSTPSVSEGRLSDKKGNNIEAISTTKTVSTLPLSRKIARVATVSRACRVIGLVAIYVYIYIHLLQALPPNSTTRFIVLALLTALFHFQISKQFDRKPSPVSVD